MRQHFAPALGFGFGWFFFLLIYGIFHPLKKRMLRLGVQLELQLEYCCFPLCFDIPSWMTATHSPYLLISVLVSFLLIFTLASTLEFVKNVHFWKLFSSYTIDRTSITLLASSIYVL